MIESCVGEQLNHLIPLPIPASIYGLVIMLILLITRKIKSEAVKETADFLVSIMPVMFIPSCVGLIASWEQLKPFWFPVIVISVVSTLLVMIATGKTTDIILKSKEDE